MKALALILGLLPSALLAQIDINPMDGATNISFEEWRAMTRGKTVVYEIGGETFGHESYIGDNKVTIQLEDGS